MAKPPKPVVYARDDQTLWLTRTVEDPYTVPRERKTKITVNTPEEEAAHYKEAKRQYGTQREDPREF
jgi:hypothetical protein